jgi:hypothetical protein
MWPVPLDKPDTPMQTSRGLAIGPDRATIDQPDKQTKSS